MLDTSVAIALRDADALVVDRIAILEAPALLSVISVVELEGGVARDPVGAKSRRQGLNELLDMLDLIAFGPSEAERYGTIVGAIGYSRRRTIDRMIAAQALVAHARLATLNAVDFHDVPALEIEDWS